MKAWAKGALIGFFVVFVGLWILLFIAGHDQNGWKCTYITGKPSYCDFVNFIFAPTNIAFVLFFSWVGFFGGIIDVKIINKIIKQQSDYSKIPLKVTSTITLTLVIVFAIVGLLAFDKWAEVMVYAVVFTIFVMLISWLVGKWRYH